MTTIASTGPASVYRCFDAGGTCLYIGSTTCVDDRMNHHILTTVWAPDVDRTEVTDHDNIAQAREVEFAEIKRLRPRWNIYGRPSRPQWQLSDYVEVILAIYARRGLGQRPPHYDVTRADRKIALLKAEAIRRFGDLGRVAVASLDPHTLPEQVPA